MDAHDRPRGFSGARRAEQGGGIVLKVAVTLLVLLLAVGVAGWQGWIPGVDPDRFGASGPSEPVHPAGTPSTALPPASGPGLALTAPGPPDAVLAAAARRTEVRTAAIADALGRSVESRALGSRFGLVVQSLGSAQPAYDVGRPVVTPASTVKLLTSVAALRAMGPDHRFATRVVTGSGRRAIVLVGGGDPLLTDRLSGEDAATSYPRPATLLDLARRTAASLKSRGVRSVRLSYDVSLYAGPSLSPTWQPTYVADNVVSPIVPLWVNEGRQVAGFSARSSDPAAEAARRFAALLAGAGVRVHGDLVQATAAPGARELARVESAPLAEVVEHVIAQSDNEGAETLLRQTALATGLPGSFTAGVGAVRHELGRLGIDTAALTMYDGSGLSRHDRVDLQTLVDVLQTASAPEYAELRSVVTSLPVAGFTGSLAYRFVDDAPDGLGFVRAKTGTLTAAGVHGLAGVAVTKRGTALLFAEVADRVRLIKTLAARAQLDKIAARLAACSC